MSIPLLLLQQHKRYIYLYGKISKMIANLRTQFLAICKLRIFSRGLVLHVHFRFLSSSLARSHFLRQYQVLFCSAFFLQAESFDQSVLMPSVKACKPYTGTIVTELVIFSLSYITIIASCLCLTIFYTCGRVSSYLWKNRIIFSIFGRELGGAN